MTQLKGTLPLSPAPMGQRAASGADYEGGKGRKGKEVTIKIGPATFHSRHYSSNLELITIMDLSTRL